MDPHRGPTSYLFENFGLPKCWTSEAQHPSCPMSNCPTLQTVDIFFSVVREPTPQPYLLNLFLISSNLFPCLYD